MFFRQYQLSCLSTFSYLIGDETTGRAVVVDPQRDITQYLDDATAHGLTIERVIETHFHADFLSGHLELARATGASICFGDEARAEFPIEGLAHGQRIELGEVVLEIRHTPGHTPESISIVVHERADDPTPWGVLTGDTLFVGDVGRPDLLTATGWDASELARRLYHSLHGQLLTLPDTTRVYPAHGAGSACGKSMSDAVSSTIGEQRAMNHALRPMTEQQFVEAITEGQSVAPLYFAFTADSNRRLHDLLDEEPPPLLGIDEIGRCLEEDAVLIDGRSPEAFASGHLRGSVNVGLDGRFAEYAGNVARPGEPIVVVTDSGREVEAKVRLGRIGFDEVSGAVVEVEHLLADHPDLGERSTRVEAAELSRLRTDTPTLQIVDVRNPAEHDAGTIPGALEIPLARLLDRHSELDPGAPTIVYCATGYRSSAAASLLRSKGFSQVADLSGGYAAWAVVDRG